MVTSIYLASHNRGKWLEFQSLMADTRCTLCPCAAGTSSPPDETGVGFVDNALIKARAFVPPGDGAVLADDSGLVVPALDGAPGVHSARYAGEGVPEHAHRERLLRALSGCTGEARRAHMVCVLVLLRAPGDPMPCVAHGVWSGHVVEQPVGDHGFGYDPVFRPDGWEHTAGQVLPAVKQAASHRARAWRALWSQLEA